MKNEANETVLNGFFVVVVDCTWMSVVSSSDNEQKKSLESDCENGLGQIKYEILFDIFKKFV